MGRYQIAISMALGAGVAVAAAAAMRAGPRGPDATPVPVVVELFTSEGCSSCPPADELLIELASAAPGEGAFVIGLSQHVDYWDRLGWTDPFSSRQFTDRQTAYSARDRSDQIYTPQMVVDGGDRFVGSNRTAALAAVRRGAAAAKVPIRLSWTPGSLGTFDIAVEPPSDERSGARADVMIAVVEDGLKTPVTRGENTGRTLRHAAVVRELRRAGTTDARGRFGKTVTININPAWSRRATRFVVFLQRRNLGRIVGAASLPLEPGPPHPAGR